MVIKYKKSYKKSFKKLPNSIQEKAIKRIFDFSKNPLEKSLNNHELSWEYSWLRSINITWDYRAIFEAKPNNTYEFVEFIFIWTHSQLY